MILKKITLSNFILFLLLFCSTVAFGQAVDLQGEWESKINYVCSRGYQNDGYNVKLNKVGDNEWTAKVYGGTVRIKRQGNSYTFAVEGEKDCIREGKMFLSTVGDTTFLRGSWEARASNKAQRGVGLCCHGSIALAKYTKLPVTEKPEVVAQTPAVTPSVAADTPVVAPVTKQLVKGDTLKLDYLIFEQGKTTLVDQKDGYKDLDTLVVIMKKSPGMRISLEGHTDYAGGAEANQKLSEERVKALKQYMVTKGIEERRIDTKGYGGTRPIVTQGAEINRQKNRRVEVVILND